MEAQSWVGPPSPATRVTRQKQGQPLTLLQSDQRSGQLSAATNEGVGLAWEDVDNFREGASLPVPAARNFCGCGICKGLTRRLTASIRAKTCAWLCCPSSGVAAQGPPGRGVWPAACSLQPPQLPAMGQRPACQALGSLS